MRSLRNDANHCVFSPYSLRTHGVPRASQSAPVVGNPSCLNRVLSQGKRIVLCTFICSLLTLFHIITLYCTLPLASAEEHKFTLSWAIGDTLTSFLKQLGRENGNPSLRIIILFALSHLL